jgi:hypothetical protein
VLAVNPITTNWCYPASGEGFPGPRTSRGFAQCLLNRAYVHKNAARYRVIIVAANWGRILEDGAMPEIFAELEYLAGKTGLVVIMPSAPQFDTDVYNAYLRSRWYGKPFDIAALGTANDAPAIRAGTALARFASGHERMVYLERCTLFNRDGRCSNLDARGLPFNADKMHISVAAAQGIARSYLDQATSQSLLARIDAAVAR